MTNDKFKLLYLEGLHVGQRFTSDSYQMNAVEIKAFAKQFDPQPFHLDESLAQDTFFKGLAASGWHTASITMRLLVGSGLPIAGGIIGASGNITWPRATRSDDVLHVEIEVTEVTPSRSRPERGIVTVHCETLNQRNEPVQTLTTRLLVFRRNAHC